MRILSIALAAVLLLPSASFLAQAQSDVVVKPRVNTSVYEGPRATARKLKSLNAAQQYDFRAKGSLAGFLEVTYPIQGFINLRDVDVAFVPPPSPDIQPRVDTVTVFKTDTLTIAARAAPIVIRPDVAIADPAPPADTRVVPKGQFTVILLSDMKYRIGNTNDTIVVPKGFVTDFASIPRPLWSVLSPTDDYKLAAVVHDYLYWFQPCTREQSDNLLMIAMQEQGVSYGQRSAVYAGVRLGGGIAWKADSTLRTTGEPRVIPDSLAHPQPLDTWDVMRRRLMQGGLRGDPHGLPTQPYCHYGDTQQVP